MAIIVIFYSKETCKQRNISSQFFINASSRQFSNSLAFWYTTKYKHVLYQQPPSLPMKLRLLYLFVVAAQAAIGSEFEAAGEDSILYPAIGTESNEANNDSVLYHRSTRGNLRRVTPSTRTKAKTTPSENDSIIQQTHRNRKLEEYKWVGRNPTVKLTRCQGEHMI